MSGIKKTSLAWKNNYFAWPILSLFVSLPYILFLYFYKYFGIRDMWSYHKSFHLLNYSEFGFVKRGIVGSYIKPIFSILKYFNIDLNTIMLINYILLFLIFSFIYWRLCISSNAPRLTKLALLITPATFQFLGFDSPRSSELVWLICFGIFCLILNKYERLNTYQSLFLGSLMSLAILSYEGSLFTILPVAFISFLYKEIKNNKLIRFKNLFLFLIPIFLTTYLIFMHGNFEPGIIEIRKLLDNVDPNIEDNLSEVLANDLVNQNIERIKNRNLNWFSNNPIFIIYYLTYIFINFQEFYKERCLKYFLQIILSFSAVLLCLVAVDFSRYIALSILVNSMCLFMIKKETKWVNSQSWTLMIFFGLLGPIGCAGMINPFPLWKYILGLI